MDQKHFQNIDNEDKEGFVIELFGEGSFRELRHISGITSKAERREFFKGENKIADLFLNPETEEPEHGYMYDDVGKLIQFEDWKALIDIDRKTLELILKKPINDTNSGSMGKSEKLEMKKLPREDLGNYWVHRWVNDDGMELAEYTNKKTEIIERRSTIKNGIPIGEITYDKESGVLKEIKAYDKDGKLSKYVDEQEMIALKKGGESQIAKARENIARDISPEEIERLKTVLIFENLAAKEELMGRDPDVKH